MRFGSVLGVIPARGGSKGIPRKNLEMFNGAPLIEWTIREAQKAIGLDRFILSSDDPRIIAVAERLGCEAPFIRPAHLATDTASSIDVMLHALDQTPGYDLAVLLQPTSPLRLAADIDGTLNRMRQTGAPGCVSVCEAPCHPYLIFKPDGTGRLAPYASPPPGSTGRRQEFEPAFRLNGAVYAVDAAWFRSTRTFVSPGQTAAYVMPTSRSIDIDTFEDLAAARRFAA